VVKATGKADHRPYAIKVVTRSAYRHFYHMMNQVQVLPVYSWDKKTRLSGIHLMMLTAYARRVSSSYLAFVVVLCYQLHLPEFAEAHVSLHDQTAAHAQKRHTPVGFMLSTSHNQSSMCCIAPACRVQF
jgi:hypothetical protein